MTKEKKIPEIEIKMTVIENPHKAKSIKLKGWHCVNRNGFSVITKSLIVYVFYKIWWKIKLPKMICYHSVGVEEELKKLFDEGKL